MAEPLTDREMKEIDRMERVRAVSPYEKGTLAAFRMRADEHTRQRIDRITEENS